MKGYIQKIVSFNDYVAFLILKRTLQQFGAMRQYNLTMDKIIEKCYNSRKNYVGVNHESIYYNMMFWPGDCGMRNDYIRKIIKLVFISRVINDSRFDEKLIRNDFLCEFSKTAFEVFNSDYHYVQDYGECVLNAIHKILPYAIQANGIETTKRKYNDVLALIHSLGPLANDSFVIGNITFDT